MIELPPLTLVLGGARSGKSRHAEALVLSANAAPIYLATGEPQDDEMAARIQRHRDRRGANWQTVEEPIELAIALTREAATGTAVLVDCLTLWLGNLMGADRDVETEISALVSALPALQAPVVFVSNEVGQGIVPNSAMARQFRDHAGLLHEEIATIADRVDFVTAGIPQRLK